MDSKQEFFRVIYNHYSEITKDKVPDEILHELSETISDYYYEQYIRFGKQYPKSIKRYSTFQIKDLDHSTTFEIIIKFLKNKAGSKYSELALSILPMTLDELRAFERNRENFYNK
jgi:hypothetical protein